MKLRVASQQQKTTHLFIRDQRTRLPSRATMIHSRVRRKLIKHAHTPRHQNTKCLVQATRAGGLRQHNRQVIRYLDAFSVALRPQTIGSNNLDLRAEKGQQAQCLHNNQLKHQQKMPRGFYGRSPHFRRLLPSNGEYSSTCCIFNISVVHSARGRSRAIPPQSIQHGHGIHHLEDNIVDKTSQVKSAVSWPAACLLSNSCNTYCASR